MKPERRFIVGVLLALVWISITAIATQPPRGASGRPAVARQVYTGTISYLGGRNGAAVTTFTLTIDSFNTDAEVQSLADALKNGGQDALLRATSKEKKGSIRIGTGLARDVSAAWASEGPEGERKITALSERWVGFSEARRGARSLDYPFTFIELYMDTNGKGEGGLIPAAKVQFKGGKNWEVENFGIYPARLTNVRLRTK